ncbi:MAG: T9SS type A sorting domain-containing protein [Bacteroidia bacterium]|nr:T9SS type A sorting domain-containing protein [Bacteroidia bacterium]
MKKIIMALLIACNCIAQPQITWQKYFYASSGYNACFGILQLNDSGFIITNSWPQRPYIGRILKTNQLGDTLKSIKINTWSNIIHTLDSNFAFAGGSTVLGQGRLTKFDIDLNELWTQYYPQFNSISVATCNDGGFLLYNAYNICKTDSLGNIIWSHNIGNISKAISCKNGDVLIVGQYSNGPEQYIACLYDSTGMLLWNRSYGNWFIFWGQSSFGGILDAVELPDGNFLAACIAQWGIANAGGDWDLMKIERFTGDTLMTRRYMPSGAYGGPYGNICYTKDSNLIATYGSAIMKTDTAGNIIWTKNTMVEIIDAIGCSDGGIAIAGQYYNQAGLSHSTYAKLDSLGNIYNFQGMPYIQPQLVSVYPNPASNQLTIDNLQLTNKPFTVTIYDVLGKAHLMQNSNATTIDISKLTPGLYVLHLQQGDTIYYGRFVKE